MKHDAIATDTGGSTLALESVQFLSLPLTKLESLRVWHGGHVQWLQDVRCAYRSPYSSGPGPTVSVWLIARLFSGPRSVN